jgi:hypothetical protein
VYRVLVWPLLALCLSSCYVQVPLEGSVPAPAPGTRLVIELTDQGRIGMERQVGPGVATVEGALVSRSDTAYDVSVSMVVGLRGTLSRWQGERIALPTGYIRRVSERRLSMGRTVAAVGAATAGIVVFVLTRSLLGGGNDAGPGPEPPPPSGN